MAEHASEQHHPGSSEQGDVLSPPMLHVRIVPDQSAERVDIAGYGASTSSTGSFQPSRRCSVPANSDTMLESDS